MRKQQPTKTPTETPETPAEPTPAPKAARPTCAVCGAPVRLCTQILGLTIDVQDHRQQSAPLTVPVTLCNGCAPRAAVRPIIIAAELDG